MAAFFAAAKRRHYCRKAGRPAPQLAGAFAAARFKKVMRENSMREADMSPSDEITVNGQNIGRLDGFRLAAGAENAAALSKDAAALSKDAAAAPLIEQEYSLQAERFAAAPNGDIAIGSDGSVRWRGAVIARLTAAEDILRPQAVLLADGFLTAAAREKVAARLARFIAFHFETVCKPLYDLAAAEALFDKPRAVALKMVERLGIVPRRDIAAQLRELDQDSRAALRRLGVRFGVYHIFSPLLLKPAAAEALTLLWALKNDAFERPGYGEVVSYLAAGRTSFPVNPEFDRQFYRLAGYRILGAKAVRVDMLERCADLIRQAVSWQPAAAGGAPRPAGAYDGRYFTISQPMLSILGITPEDMEEVLKQLGYAPHSIPRAEYEAFMAKTGSAGAGAAAPAAEPVGDWAAALPKAGAASEAKAEAEPGAAAAEPAAAKTETAGAETAAAGGQQAEPVGDWAKTAAANAAGAGEAAKAEAEAPVLLWRYQKRSFKKPQARNFTPRPRAEGEAGAAGSGRERGENPRESRGRDNDNRGGGRNGGGRGDNRPGKKPYAGSRAERGEGSSAPRREREGGRPARNFDGKKQSKSYSAKPSRPVNIEDSPFAALAALRDKLGK